MIGFYIKELRVKGKGLEDAVIVLEKGLNVINGPSNTGKSYILKCIDYMFGAEKLKEVRECKGYEKILLEIRDLKDDSPITILRHIKGNDIYYDHTDINNFSEVKLNKLKSKHSADKDDNISKFLLKQIGITQNKYMVKNSRGEKKSLGYRGIANLAIIDETDITSEEKTPIYNGIKTDNTYCKSVFKYLLTGVDDILCQEIEKDDIRRAKIVAKIEYINDEINRLEKKQKDLKDEIKLISEYKIVDIDEYSEKIEKIETQIREKREKIVILHRTYGKLTLNKDKIKIFLDKFKLLKEQYKSDLDRLRFIQDGEDCLSQIHINYCPICNNNINHEVFNNEDKDEIYNASHKEQVKIQIHLEELDRTINESKVEYEKIKTEYIDCKNNILMLEKDINEILETELNPLKCVIEATTEYKKLLYRLSDIDNDIDNKRLEIIAFEESKKEKREKLQYNNDISDSIISSFCQEIKNTLIACGYDKVETVKFSEDEQDIIIDGVLRRNNGKGFRAFFYTAFSIALIKFTSDKNLHFSKTLLLDSPLTTLKEEEVKKGEVQDGDMIDISLQDSLFDYLSENFLDKQIIVFENKRISEKVSDKCNHIKFTKNKEYGRYGFFPINI